ncbi:MAG: LysE family translocator, partial [Candidatus Thermoplasmatota archaeon]|nr:LysE family translocator [Candidatus Thermoplasmatota archaeon]
QFVEPEFTWIERLMVASIAMVIDGGWYILVALIISGTPMLGMLERNARKFELSMAFVLAGLGIWILL